MSKDIVFVWYKDTYQLFMPDPYYILLMKSFERDRTVLCLIDILLAKIDHITELTRRIHPAAWVPLREPEYIQNYLTFSQCITAGRIAFIQNLISAAETTAHCLMQALVKRNFILNQNQSGEPFMHFPHGEDLQDSLCLAAEILWASDFCARTGQLASLFAAQYVIPLPPSKTPEDASQYNKLFWKSFEMEKKVWVDNFSCFFLDYAMMGMFEFKTGYIMYKAVKMEVVVEKDENPEKEIIVTENTCATQVTH